MALSASQKAILHGDVLVKCSFELSNIGENQESRGDLFMSAKTHRLYISISLETVVISDGSRIISDGGGSRTMVGLEDSNSMLQLGDITNGSTTLLPGELSTEPA